MTKSISLYLIIFLSIAIFVSMAMSESYKEPNYSLISKKGRIETRQYESYVIAKTSNSKGSSELNSNMFRVLAGYIFGGNSKQESIPMTTPVITKESSSSYDMIFFMLDASTESDLPIPNSSNVSIEQINMGKIISIRFGMWATDERVDKYKKRLGRHIEENNISVKSPLMIAQYNSPWTMPPFRRNELMYEIN